MRRPQSGLTHGETFQQEWVSALAHLLDFHLIHNSHTRTNGWSQWTTLTNATHVSGHSGQEWKGVKAS